MKKVSHKALSLIMAIVVLFSTMSFTINMHYCGDTLVETSFFHKAKGCGMEMQNPSTPGCAVTKKKCCNEKTEIIKGQDELKLNFDKISFDQQLFVASFLHTYQNLFEYLEVETPTLKAYPPPLIVKQIYKLDETYLI